MHYRIRLPIRSGKIPVQINTPRIAASAPIEAVGIHRQYNGTVARWLGQQPQSARERNRRFCLFTVNASMNE
jgi:hypothetical protein